MFPEFRDNRGVAPAIGYLLIISFIALAAGGLIIFGQAAITGDEDPRPDANFEVGFTYIENTTTGIEEPYPTIIYDTGDDFTTQETDTIRLLADTATGSKTRTLYNETGITGANTSQTVITEQTVVMDGEFAKANGIEIGSAMTIVWSPTDRDSFELVLDEFAGGAVLPTRANDGTNGSVSGGTGVFCVNGSQPQLSGESCG